MMLCSSEMGLHTPNNFWCHLYRCSCFLGVFLFSILSSVSIS